MSYDNWRKRLAIFQQFTTVALRREAVAALKINFSQPQPEDEGYYRKPITQPKLGADGKANGQHVVTGWTPVAYFLHEGALMGTVGAQGRSRNMKPDELLDEQLWSYVVSNPIPWDWYDAVVNKGLPWPDAAPVASVGLDGPMVQQREEPIKAIDDVIPNREVIGDNSNAEPAREPHIEHAEGIDNAVRAAEDLKATDETTAAVLLGAKNRLAELRLAADKTGHAIYDPLRAVYVAAQKPWPIMVAKADAMEKKLNTRYLTWRADELRKANELARKVAEEKLAIEEANERAAQRAIANGTPEPPPAVPEVSPAAMPAPAPVTPTYRASGQRIAPKEVEKWWFDGIDDFAKVYEHFKDNADVKSALIKAATAAIVNGQEVPGTRRHFGLI